MEHSHTVHTHLPEKFKAAERGVQMQKGHQQFCEYRGLCQSQGPVPVTVMMEHSMDSHEKRLTSTKRSSRFFHTC